MKVFKEQFSDEQWDRLLVRWVENKVEAHEIDELKSILCYDSRFRESFCDWVKSLRGVKKNEKL